MIIQETRESNNTLAGPSAQNPENVMKSTKCRKMAVPWSIEQKRVVCKYFQQNIRKKMPPKRNEIETLIRKFGDLLQNKDWLKIKVLVQNIYTGKCKAVCF